VQQDVLSTYGKTGNPSGIEVRPHDILVMTVKQGPTLELVGTEDLANA